MLVGLSSARIAEVMAVSESRKGTERGLYEKYEVRKEGEPVDDCFVLEPTDDKAALEALRTYSRVTPDHELAVDLQCWIQDIERGDQD